MDCKKLSLTMRNSAFYAEIYGLLQCERQCFIILFIAIKYTISNNLLIINTLHKSSKNTDFSVENL